MKRNEEWGLMGPMLYTYGFRLNPQPWGKGFSDDDDDGDESHTFLITSHA